MLELPKERTKVFTDIGKMNMFLYGLPKCGKSTFASKIPKALFLATEQGHHFLEVYKVDIKKWEDMYTLGKELKNANQFSTLVIDIVDYLYKMCEHYIVKKHGVEHVSDMAYGKGYSLIKDEFNRVISGLNAMGFGMVFISHAKEREQSTKSQKWSVMGTSLGASAENFVCSMCDFIFYAYIDENGKRLVRTKPSKHIIAGDRTGKLPEKMDFDFDTITKEINK